MIHEESLAEEQGSQRLSAHGLVGDSRVKQKRYARVAIIGTEAHPKDNRECKDCDGDTTWPVDQISRSVIR